MKKTMVLILAVSFLVGAGLFAAPQETKPPLKHELVKLSYVRPQDIVMLLRPYFSRDGRLEFSESQKFVSVTDTAENIEKILAAIKEIDVKPSDVQFTVQLVLASEDGAPTTDESLADNPIIKELKSFLKYKSFSLLDTALVRALDADRSELTMGRKGEFILDLRPRVIKKDKADDVQIEVQLRQVGELYTRKETRQEENRNVTTEQPLRSSQNLIESNLTVKSGEKTVVGVSRTAGGEKGLILIISAKIL